MLYLFGKIITNEKSIVYSLQNIYGINIFQSREICKYIGVNPKSTINKLNENQLNNLKKYINKYINIEQDLKKNVQDNIENLLNIKNYRGLRLVKGLPIHGQRTRTNAKTSKKIKKYKQ